MGKERDNSEVENTSGKKKEKYENEGDKCKEERTSGKKRDN